VKGCGKSAPRRRQRRRQGKPHREQDRIGTARLHPRKQEQPGSISGSGRPGGLHQAPGNRSGEQRSSFGAPSCRLAGGHGQRGTGRSRGAPQLLPWINSVGGVIERWHGQPGQRERRQDTGPGNRSSVQLRKRRSVRRQDRTGGHRCRATGGGAIGCGAGQPETVAKTGIARRAFGHDGRCVGRAKANARTSCTTG
jgi:hypothetical protein